MTPGNREKTRAKVWYLYHSGFAVETREHFLVFDYWMDRPRGAGLDKGVIDTRQIADKDVIAFVSHSHGDHFNSSVLHWGEEIKKYRVILSDDIYMNSSNGIRVYKNTVYKMDDFMLETLESTDEGLAFLLKIDGLTIYHAGDLNWWHWAGEPQEDNIEMARRYREQIDLLKGKKIDLAFVPVDPRLGDEYSWGIDYFMESVGADNVFPMHFGDDSEVVGRLLQDERSAGYKDKIRPLTQRGEQFTLG